MSSTKALLILNGDLDLDECEIMEIIKKENIEKIIAVDGGANNTRKVNLIPDIIIGDLDSITKENKNYYQDKNVKFIKHPIEKDQTDSEIAVDFCKEYNLKEIFFAAALGGRIDQQIANINLLEYVEDLKLKAKIISKNIEIALIPGTKVFKNKKNYRLSLIPQSKVVEKVRISGCKYNLASKDIYRSQTRGISNKIENNRAQVDFESGLLIYILENLK